MLKQKLPGKLGKEGKMSKKVYMQETCTRCGSENYRKGDPTPTGKKRRWCKDCGRRWTVERTMKPPVTGVQCPECRSFDHIIRGGARYKCKNVSHHATGNIKRFSWKPAS